MDNSEFVTLTDAAFERIESSMETCGVDVDFFQVGTGIFEIEFDDGSQIIVNRHEITQEIWVAARSGGFHFYWDGKAWCDTKNGRELMVVLSDLISAQTGESVVLR